MQNEHEKAVALNPLVSVRIREDELMEAFEAIAKRRMRRLCQCDLSVGYECRRCKRLIKRQDPGSESSAVDQQNNELAFRYASLLLRAARIAADKEYAAYMEEMIENQHDHEASHMPWML